MGARPLFCKMIEQQFDSVILAMGHRRLSKIPQATAGRESGIGRLHVCTCVYIQLVMCVPIG